jgi:hypothetical protein
MAAEIHRRTGLPADEEIVELAFSELVETGLVVLDDPEHRSAVSRRALTRRLALSSTLALMLPVVETVVVPPAEALQPFSPIPSPTQNLSAVMLALLTRRPALATVFHGAGKRVRQRRVPGGFTQLTDSDTPLATACLSTSC